MPAMAASIPARSAPPRLGFRVVVSRTGPTTVLRLRPGDVAGNELTVAGAHDDVAARDICANMAHANVLIWCSQMSSPR
jgi:hypothetical protein